METRAGMLAIEVKARDRVEATDHRALRNVRDVVGNRWAAGLVVYRGDRIERVSDRIWALPGRRLFT